MKFIGSTEISVLIAFSSLIVSFIALYFTVLKRGKVKVSLYKHVKDVKASRSGRYNNVNDGFNISIPVIINNNGSKSVAIKNLKWNINFPEYLEHSIITQPQIHGIKNDLTVLNPYEHFIDNLMIRVDIKGSGMGYGDEYTAIVKSASEMIKKDKSVIICSYLICGKYRMKRRELSFDISKLMKYSLLEDIQ